MAVGIGQFLPSEWVLVSGAVFNDTLIVCRRSVSTGEVSFVLLKSAMSATVPSGGRDTITVPSFVEAQHLETVVVISHGCASGYGGVFGNGERGAVLMNCKPVLFSLTCSRGSSLGPPGGPSMSHDAAISSELFSCLFDLQFALLKLPIFLIGCQNGNIYYTNFCLRRPSSSSSDGRDTRKRTGTGPGSCGLLCPLYSLEEPVVGIHSAHFPRCRQPAETASSFKIVDEMDSHEQDTDRTHNVLIFLGQSGKIVICHAASDDSKSSLPSFLEYHVPSPILSSVLMPDQCLLYSTPQGIHRICLRPQCADAQKEKLPRLGSRQPLRIPKVSFMFPEKVCDSDCGLHLLQLSTGEWDSSGQGDSELGQRKDDSSRERNDVGSCVAETKKDSLCCLCLSFDGRLFTFHFSPNEAQGALHCKDSTQVGQEIKHCLQSIQTQGEKLDGLTKKLQSLNSLLAELKSALDVLCAVKEASSPPPSPLTGPSANLPLTCSFRVTCEAIGARVERHCVAVELKLNSNASRDHRNLSSGWYFLVTSSPSMSRSLATSSKSVSLEGLASGASITVKVDVDVCEGWSVGGGGSTSAGYIECLVHYSPQHLLECLPGRTSTGRARSFKSVSLSLARKEYSVLDFLSLATSTAGTASTAAISSRATLSTYQLKMVKSIISPSQGDPTRPTTRAFASLPHSAKLTLPVGVAVTGIRAATVRPSSSEPERDVEESELAVKFLKVLVPTAEVKMPTGRGGARGGATEVCWGFDGGVVQLRMGPVQGSGNKAMLSLEIQASSRSVLVSLVGAIGRRLLAVATVSSSTVAGHTPTTADHTPATADHTSSTAGHKTSRDEVCVKLERLKQLLQEVSKVQREVGVVYQKRRSKCMSAEAYSKALDVNRDKTLNIYCRLREIL